MELKKIMMKFDRKKIIDEYFQRWKAKNDSIYHFAELIKLHVLKEGNRFNLVDKVPFEEDKDFYENHK